MSQTFLFAQFRSHATYLQGKALVLKNRALHYNKPENEMKNVHAPAYLQIPLVSRIGFRCRSKTGFLKSFDAMKRLLCLAILILSGLSAIGQDNSPAFYRQYATQKYMKELVAAHPEMREARSAIERNTYDFMRYGLPDTPTIAVVFHVVGSPAAAITMADVQKQIDALNKDFSSLELPTGENMHQAWQAERFDERVARPTIHFCLANRDPMGRPANGVLYVPSEVPNFPVGTGVMNGGQGGSEGWDPQQYLNIYVTALEDDVAGYAQMPGGPLSSDGIVINAGFFARQNNQGAITPHPSMANYKFGRTLSHLVGSYLNLYELWNDETPCADDYVHDTPIHNAPNYEKPGYRHVSTCGDNPVEMTMNLMDNTDDDVQYMFTNGQMMRMYATLAPNGGPRAGLRAMATQCTGGLFAEGGIDERGSDASEVPAGKLTVKIYPNPASDGFTVIVTAPCEEELRLTAFNQLGMQQYSKQVDGAVVGMTNSVHVSSRGWAPGMYLVQVRCGDEVATAKLLLER